jgi:hypothetical protein
LHKLPSAREIVVLAYPKSGSTWLARLLGDLLNAPVAGDPGFKPLAEEGADRTGDFIIRQSHLLERGDKRYIIGILRDPRDVAVSAAYYWQMASIEQAIECMALGAFPLTHKLFSPPGYKDYMLDMMSGILDDLTSYEMLLLDPVSELQALCDGLGVEPVRDIMDVVERQSFAMRKSKIGDHLPHGAAVQNRLMRKGEMDSWRDEMRDSDRRLFHDSFWRILNDLGYENDTEWWRAG